MLIKENQNEILQAFNNLFNNNIIYNKESLIAILSITGTFFAYFSL